LEQQSPSEKERSEARTEEVVELVAKMNECGAPPKDIMGEMPPGEFTSERSIIEVIR